MSQRIQSTDVALPNAIGSPAEVTVALDVAFPIVKDVRASEDDIARTISYLPVMGWYCRVDRCRAIVGASWSQFTGRVYTDGSWRDCIHPDDLGWFDALDPIEAIPTGYIRRTVRILRSDGVYLWHEIRAAPIVDPVSHAPAGWFFTALDDEERRRLEAERAGHLEEALLREERLKLATAAARIGVFDFDFRNNTVTWSGFAHELFGMPVGGAPTTIGAAFGLLHPDDRVAARATLRDAVIGGLANYTNSYRVQHPDGQIRQMISQVKLIRDATGEAVRAIGAVSDVTEATNAARVVAEVNTRLQATYDSAGVGIAEIDRDGRLLRVNNTWASYAGIDVKDLLGRTYWDFLVREEDRTWTQERLLELITGEIDVADAVREEARPNGGTIWFDTKMTAVRDEHGGFLYAVRVKRDITASHIAREQERLLLAELTHRVKNTIATIQSISSQTIHTAKSLDEFHDTFLGRLHSISATHSLLIEKGRTKVGYDQEWARVGFDELVQTELRLNRDIEVARWSMSGATIDLNPSAAVNIGLLVHELVSNARRYGSFSNSRGEVTILWTIETRGDEECLCIDWLEQDGPVITSVGKKGFGTRLLTTFTRQLQGSYKPVYAEGGLRAELVIPTRTIRAAPKADLMRI